MNTLSVRRGKISNFVRVERKRATFHRVKRIRATFLRGAGNDSHERFNYISQSSFKYEKKIVSIGACLAPTLSVALQLKMQQLLTQQTRFAIFRKRQLF